MKSALPLLALAALATVVQPARAETLRCTRGIAEVGDTRLSVYYKCGEPLLQDSYCAPLYQRHERDYWPVPPAVLGLPCLRVDEWLYDRGPGQLLATVRFQSGVVQSIRYGHVPR